MLNHAPEGYRCPFCRLSSGGEAPSPTGSMQADIVYRDHDVLAFVASQWWPNNAGHVLVVPTHHYENIYDLPSDIGAAIHRVAQRVALAFKATYRCDGVSTRQHNEPAGNQDVWHYHLHVFPRYDGDQLYISQKRHTSIEERQPYTDKLRRYLSESESIHGNRNN